MLCRQMIMIALTGFLAMALQASAQPSQRTYVVLDAEDCEVRALEKGSLRLVSPGVMDGEYVEFTCVPQDVQNPQGEVIGKAAYLSTAVRVDCRKQTFSLVRTTFYREDGSVLLVETYPGGQEGWLHDATTKFVRLACSQRLQKRYPGKTYASPAEFLAVVRRSF